MFCGSNVENRLDALRAVAGIEVKPGGGWRVQREGNGAPWIFK